MYWIIVVQDKEKLKTGAQMVILLDDMLPSQEGLCASWSLLIYLLTYDSFNEATSKYNVKLSNVACLGVPYWNSLKGLGKSTKTMSG